MIDFFYETYEVIVKKVGNEIQYYEETVECQYLIFWLESHRMVHCHIAKLKPYQRVTIDQGPLQMVETD
jgi:hypothetical protein